MRDVYWRRICSSRCCLPWLCAIALVMASGCSSPPSTAKQTLRHVYCAGSEPDGIKIELDPVVTTPGAGVITVTIGGIVLVHDPNLAHPPIRWRGSVWIDTNGNGIVDAGEIVIQDASAPPPPAAPPGPTPPPGAPPPPTAGTFTVPAPIAGQPTTIKVIIELEYTDLAGNPKQYKTEEKVVVRH